MKKIRKFTFPLLLLAVAFALAGCRMRVIYVVAEPEPELPVYYDPAPQPEEPEEPEQEEPEEPEEPEPEEYEEPDDPEEPEPEPDEPEPQEPEPQEPEPQEPEDTDIISPQTLEDPPPPTDLIPETPIITPEVAEAAYIPQPETSQGTAPEPGDDTPPTLTETPSEPTEAVTVETPSPYAAGDTTLDADGDGTLGLIIDRHMGVLNRGLGSLFECQRLYVYFEHLHDFYTINRNSHLHNLVIDSGGFNAAVRRGNDALVVDPQWVTRQNPSLIIRTVTSDILGQNINDTGRPQALRNEILNREGMESVTAITNRRILLLSYELFETYEGRLIAKLHIAHAMYPTLFAGVNLQELYEEIAGAGGVDYTRGIFVFH